MISIGLKLPYLWPHDSLSENIDRATMKFFKEKWNAFELTSCHSFYWREDIRSFILFYQLIKVMWTKASLTTFIHSFYVERQSEARGKKWTYINWVWIIATSTKCVPYLFLSYYCYTSLSETQFMNAKRIFFFFLTGEFWKAQLRALAATDKSREKKKKKNERIHIGRKCRLGIDANILCLTLNKSDNSDDNLVFWQRKSHELIQSACCFHLWSVFFHFHRKLLNTWTWMLIFFSTYSCDV